jgi:hypothetical protein
MEPTRFDDFTEVLTTPTSRRQALKAIAAIRREVSRQRTRIDQQRRNARTPETNDGDHAMNDQAGVYAGKVVPERGGKQ